MPNIKKFKRVPDSQTTKNGAIDFDVMIPAGGRHLSDHIWLGLLGEVLKHDVIGSLQTGNQSANSLYSSRQILPPEVIIFTSQDGD